MRKNILNIAVIGCSNMARLHMQGVVEAEGANLYAICDTANEMLEKRLQEFKVEKVCNDYKELVCDEKVDAVVIVTPDKTHLEMTCAFLKAGKAVLCEKPMALSLSECEEMMRVEKQTGGKLMIGQICRCTPGFMKAKEIVDNGQIGELIFVESEYAHNYSGARGYNDWRVDPDRHIFIGGGCHAVDLIRWIAGDPTEVYAYGNHKSLLDWPTDDTAIAIYKLPNNVMGKVFVSSGCKRNYTMRSVFYGTRGTVICDNTSDHITLFEEGEGKDYHKAQIIPVDINNHNASAEIAIFIQDLKREGKMTISSIEGASTVAVCCATVESIGKGTPISIKYPEV